MRYSKKAEVIGYVILLLLWFIGSQLLVGNVTYLIVGKAEYEDFCNVHRYAISLTAQVLCLSVVLGIDYKFKQLEIRAIRLKLREVFTYMGLGVLLYVICIMINMILLPYFPGYSAIADMFEHGEPILSFIVIVIMAPILEEYVFRGKVQSFIKREFTASLGVLAQAALFGSLHSLALQKIYATIMGIFLGTIKERTNKLQSTIIVHMTVNFIGWMIGVCTKIYS